MEASVGEKALLGALVLLFVLFLAVALAYLEAEHGRIVLEARLGEAVKKSRELAAEKRYLEKRVGELEGENKRLRSEVENLSSEVSGLRERLRVLEDEVERLRERLGEEEAKAAIYELLFDQPPIVLGKLNATVRVSVEGGQVNYIVEVGTPLPRGSGLFAAIAQVKGGSLEKMWINVSSVPGSREIRVKVPLHKLSLMRTIVYVGLAENREGVYIVRPPEVVVEAVNVRAEESVATRCMLVDVRATYTGSGKKPFYRVVAEVEPGVASTRWTASLVLMEGGAAYKLGSGNAVCVKKGVDVVLALLPLPLSTEG